MSGGYLLDGVSGVKGMLGNMCQRPEGWFLFSACIGSKTYMFMEGFGGVRT